MQEIQRIAAVNDLSGFGRCSLTVSIPILSAMGFQVCPVPTAVLSSHTGYPDPLIRDFTEDMEAYLAHWERLGLTFACGYTGFLGNERQAELLEPFLCRLRQQGALRLVDPAMADHGSLYSSCSPNLIPAMARLVSLASVATPNLTELCLLTGEEYAAVVADPTCRSRVEEMARRNRKKADLLYRNTDWNWYTDDSVNLFSMGYKPEVGFWAHWDLFAEQLSIRSKKFILREYGSTFNHKRVQSKHSSNVSVYGLSHFGNDHLRERTRCCLDLLTLPIHNAKAVRCKDRIYPKRCG